MTLWNFLLNKSIFSLHLKQHSLFSTKTWLKNRFFLTCMVIKWYLSSEGLVRVVHNQWWDREQWRMWRLPQSGKWQKWRSWETWWRSVLVWCPWLFQENSTQSIPWKPNTSHTVKKKWKYHLISWSNTKFGLNI